MSNQAKHSKILKSICLLIFSSSVQCECLVLLAPALFLSFTLWLAGAGQGICANHQADGPAYKDQGGHQLQHGQWAEVRGAGEAVQEAVPPSPEAHLCSQAIPPAEGPQWGEWQIFSCHTPAFWSRLNRDGDRGEIWSPFLFKSKVFCSSAVSSEKYQCIINQIVLGAFSLSSSSPAFNAQLFFPPILQIRSQLYWTTSTSCSFHMTMINQIVNLNFRNNLCKLDQNENQVTHLSEVSPPQILNCKQTHTVVHFVIYCYSLYFSPPFL